MPSDHAIAHESTVLNPIAFTTLIFIRNQKIRERISIGLLRCTT